MNKIWESKFGFTKNPFKDNIDTDLFFRTRQHEEAIIKIKIGIEDQHALILLTGASGTGKTLISQVVMNDLDPSNYVRIFIFAYPGMSKGALIGSILDELEIDSGRLVNDRLNALHEVALLYYKQGKQLVIVVDEAHFLKADALHVLRTLSNIETEHEKLITVLLIAEQTMHKRLQARSYDSLRGRITFSLSLEPLSMFDMEQYIKYRLLKCGGDTNLLNYEIYKTVHKSSNGIPREINKILYTSLIDIATRNRQLSTELIETVWNEIGVENR